MPKTGLTGTISLATSGLSFSFTKIGEIQFTRGKDQVSHLGTTAFEEYEPGDLAEPGECEVEGWFEGFHKPGNINAVAETITITYPKSNSGSSAAANVAGTGFLVMLATPDLQKGQRNKRKLRIAFDGKTGPAFTREAGSGSSS